MLNVNISEIMTSHAAQLYEVESPSRARYQWCTPEIRIQISLAAALKIAMNNSNISSITVYNVSSQCISQAHTMCHQCKNKKP